LWLYIYAHEANKLNKDRPIYIIQFFVNARSFTAAIQCNSIWIALIIALPLI